jgi:hypothetical protein
MSRVQQATDALRKGIKYGQASLTPWHNVGVGVGFSTSGACWSCLYCRTREWVECGSRRREIEALQRILAHVLVCPQQPQDGPVMEHPLDGEGPSAMVITAKGEYALVTGEITDEEGRALHDRLAHP